MEELARHILAASKLYDQKYKGATLVTREQLVREAVEEVQSGLDELDIEVVRVLLFSHPQWAVSWAQERLGLEK